MVIDEGENGDTLSMSQSTKERPTQTTRVKQDDLTIFFGGRHKQDIESVRKKLESENLIGVKIACFEVGRFRFLQKDNGALESHYFLLCTRFLAHKQEHKLFNDVNMHETTQRSMHSLAVGCGGN